MDEFEILKTAKPVAFTTDEVNAVLNNKKSQKAIFINPQPWRSFQTGRYLWSKTMEEMVGENELKHKLINSPFAKYKKGDLLYVKETWQSPKENWNDALYFMYKAGWESYDTEDEAGFPITIDVKKWRSSTVMPKEAARIFLQVSDVSVKRLQDMTQEDSIAEGFEEVVDPVSKFTISPLCCFMNSWNHHVPKHPNKFKRHLRYWNDNPWVYVVKFTKINAE